MRITNLKRINNIIIKKPSEIELFPFLENQGGVEAPDSDHPLNNKMLKKKMQNADEILCYEFFEDFIFTGFGDGLICSWQVEAQNVEEIEPDFIPLLGHTNKIN